MTFHEVRIRIYEIILNTRGPEYNFQKRTGASRYKIQQAVRYLLKHDFIRQEGDFLRTVKDYRLHGKIYNYPK